MLHEKRENLDSEKQKRLLERLIAELSKSHSDLYYRPTSEVAVHLKAYIDGDAALLAEEKALLDRLSQRDIEVLLSLH